MSNFNSYFKNEGCKRIVNKFFTGVDIYNENKITSLDYRIVPPPEQPASWYVENGETATFIVEVLYTINDDPEIKISTFEVPREVDGVFVIDGSYRVASNRLEVDFDCRIKMSGSGDKVINFDYFRVYDIEKQQLRIKRQDPSQTSIPERGTIIKLDKLEKALQDPKYKEHLQLTPRQSLKWQVKLDLDYKPTEITPKLIDEALMFGDDRLKDLVVDKTIESVAQSFMRYVFRGNNGRNFITAKKNITEYFKKQGRLKEEQESLSRMFYRFFKGAAIDVDKTQENDLQVPPGVNAINLESLKSRIVVPETVAINASMLDLIDVADTPINNNTNKQNALTVSTHVTDDGIMFDVYTPDFQKVTIPYLEYLNNKVVASEYVDYDTKQIKPNEQGMVEVKYRMKRMMVPKDEISLIDLHPDYRLSSTTRRIPFVNLSDSVRISMGSSMLKQSIPLPHAERPLVDSGNYDDLAENVLSEKFAFDKGKVKEITERAVIIELPDKTTVEMPRRSVIKSQNDVSVYSEPKVKVGQKVKKGDIITGAVGMEPDTYKAGVNALVLFHAYFGLVNEDALVISQSFADKIASYSIVDMKHEVKNLNMIKWIAPVGTEVKSGDSVMTLWKAVKLDEINKAMAEKLGGLFGNDKLSEYTIAEEIRVPNNIDSAVVSDVMIQKQLKPKLKKGDRINFDFTYSSDEYIENYQKTMDRQVIYDKYPDYVAAQRLDPIKMDPDQIKVVYTVRIRLIKNSPAIVGEKITSRYGGKGVTSEIRPDSEMPLVIDPTTGEKKRVEVVMNPYSTVNRKIPAVILENQLGLIAHHLHDKVDELKKTKTGQKKILPLLKKYYGNRFEGMEVEEFIKQHENLPLSEVYYFNVGSFSRFTPELVEGWMDELGLKSQLKTLIPADQLVDWEEVEESLGKEEADKLREEKKGQFQEVNKPLQAGYMTLERLYHIPSYSNKVSTGLFNVDINPKKDQPIMRRGKYRLTGQSIGEMELSALLAKNNKAFIQHTRKESAQLENQMFLNNLLALGLSITDERGYGVGGSSLRTDIQRLKSKFRIKNAK